MSRKFAAEKTVELFPGVINEHVEVNTGSARKFIAKGFVEVPAIEIVFSTAAHPHDRTHEVFSVEAAQQLRAALPEPQAKIETLSEAMARVEKQEADAYEERIERHAIGDWLDVRFNATGRTRRVEVVSVAESRGGARVLMVRYTMCTREDGNVTDIRPLTLSDEIVSKVCSKAERKLAASKRARDLFERVLRGDDFYIALGLQFKVKTLHRDPDDPDDYGTTIPVPYSLYSALSDAGLIRHARNGRDDAFQTDLELTARGVAAVLHGVW